MRCVAWKKRKMRAAVALSVLSATGASTCGNWTGTSDPHHPGAALGSFHVTASRTASTCGEGALGSMESWAFDVKLSRGETTLFWDNGAEIIPGALSPDDVGFAFDTSIVVDMREGQMSGSVPPCSIRRIDKAAGALDSAGPDVQGFTGSLSYEFQVEPGPKSDCSDLVIGEAPVFEALPCAMAYDLAATLKEPPPEAGAGEEPL